MTDARHILVVDDEPQITRVLRTTLSTHGYELRVANDGDAALDVMKDWTPDLVITDLSMPNMTGIELCRKIRTRSQIPIIVLSVRGEEKTKVQALDAGAEEALLKISVGLRQQQVAPDVAEVGDVTGAVEQSFDGAFAFVRRRLVEEVPRLGDRGNAANHVKRQEAKDM